MSKNLNKIVAFAIGVSIFTGSIVPAMADTVNNSNVNNGVQATSSVNNKVLTLNEAFESAKAKSNTLAILDKNIQLMNSINGLNEKLDDVNNLTDLTEDYNEDKRKLTLDKLEQKREFQIDKLKQDVTKAYNGLIISSKEINKLKNDIELQKEEIEQAKLKRSLGLMTDINIDQVQISLQSNQNTLDNKQNVFNDDKYNFKVLTGKDVDKYVLEDTIKYDKFELSGSLDEYLDSVIGEFTTYSEQLNELESDYWNDDDNKISNSDVSKAKDYYDEHKDDAEPKLDLSQYGDDIEGMKQKINAIADYVSKTKETSNALSKYTGILSARMNYLSQKSAAEISEIQLNETKDQYKKSLRTMYTNLLNIEKSIDLIQANVELKNKQVKVDKINYDLGLKTKLEYDKSVNECETLNNQLLSAIDNYNNLKAQLEKPWLVLS